MKNWLNDIIQIKFITRIGIYYLFHIRIYIVLLGKSHSRDLVRNNRPDRVIVSSLRKDNRNLRQRP